MPFPNPEKTDYLRKFRRRCKYWFRNEDETHREKNPNFFNMLGTPALFRHGEPGEAFMIRIGYGYCAEIDDVCQYSKCPLRGNVMKQIEATSSKLRDECEEL